LPEEINGGLADLWTVGGAQEVGEGRPISDQYPPFCPQCGWKLTGKFSRCPRCGAELSLIQCPYCGGQIPASTDRCPRCTAPLEKTS